MKKLFGSLLIGVLLVALVMPLALPPIPVNAPASFWIDNPYQGGTPYKGQLHCHSTNSDGHLSPTELVTSYRDIGYDFIAITDHNVTTEDPSVSGILFIPGTERGTVNEGNGHMVRLGISEIGDTDPQVAINEAVAENGIASLAHPNWENGNWTDNTINSLDNFASIEVYNHIITLMAPLEQALAEDKWDYALSNPQDRKVWGVAVDDFHQWGVLGSTWVTVYAENCTYSTILDSLRKGNFYASKGLDFTSISVSEKTITVVSANASINVTWKKTDGATVKTETGVTTSNYTAIGSEGYIRAVISDGTNYAWTQPFFINTFRTTLSFNASNITSNVTDAPIRVLLDNTRFDFTQALANGSDIRFEDQNGTHLEHEIEWYDADNETACFWVKVPQIDAESDYTDYIYLFSNGASRVNYPINKHNVWRSNYEIVYHFNEMSGNVTVDATSNNRTGTLRGNTSWTNYCLNFDGTNSDVYIESFGFNYNSLSFTAWIYPTDLNGRFVVLGQNNTANIPFIEVGTSPSFGGITRSVTVDIPGLPDATTTANVVSTNLWQHLTVVKYVANFPPYVFINSTLCDYGGTDNITYASTSSPKTIGQRGLGSLWFKGMIDEVRMCNVVLSESEIKVDYMNFDDTLLNYANLSPTVSTLSATSIGNEAATLGGNITDMGASTITIRGFQWGLATGNYTSNWTENGDFGAGDFSHQVEGLTEGVTYYFRALATNAYGTSYGSELSFTTMALKLHIIWQYGATFEDQSGSGNTAFPTFKTTGDNASVSANVTQQRALVEPQSPSTNATSGGWTMITALPSEPEGMYDEGGTAFPGGAEMQTLADNLRLPVEAFLFPLAIGTSLLGFIGVFAATRRTKAGANGSMFLAVITSMVIYILWTVGGGGVVPAWPIAIFVLVAILLFLWRKPYENPLS